MEMWPCNQYLIIHYQPALKISTSANMSTPVWGTGE